MAAMDFPVPTYIGQQHSNGIVTYQWDGVVWNIVPQPGPMAIGDTPPANPAIGQQWFRTTNCCTYIWYNDGTSSQWVQDGAAGTQPAAPSFLARTTTDIGVINGNTLAAFGSVNFNRGNYYNPATYRFTAPQTGVYHFDACLSYSAGTPSAGFYGIALAINGVSALEIYQTRDAGVLYLLQISSDLPLNASDYVTVLACLQGAAGAPVYQSGRSYFSGHMVP